MPQLPVKRTRIVVGFSSAAVIGLELVLMRQLSIRFWHHLAYMVISVALLGFGASGALLAVASGRIAASRARWLRRLGFGLACCLPACVWLAQMIPLDPYFLGWNLAQECLHVLCLELVLCVPFVLAGSIVGVTLTDDARRVSGHYAASLVGSAAGAAWTILAMGHWDTNWLVLFYATGCYITSLGLLRFRCSPDSGLWEAGFCGVILLLFVSLRPGPPTMAPYKSLAIMRAMPATEVLASADGPLGRIDVVAGPAIHHAPGLSLSCPSAVPPHALLAVDGEAIGAVFDCASPEDWRFMDYTTGAAGYHLRTSPSVLVVGAGTGADIGLALLHRSPRITALEMNPQLVALMRGPLAERGGSIYDGENVNVLIREARGYLVRTSDSYDLIQVPAVDASGVSGAGLYASQECYLYTVEAIETMLDRLVDGGVLCVTRWARTPPRDGLRLLDTAATALRRRGLDPARHCAMLRSWVTVTLLVSDRPLSDADCDAVRSFCEPRCFDVCWLPGLRSSETNRFHVLDRPLYYLASQALLGDGRALFLRDYLFNIEATTDDRPYFHHFLRWKSLPALHAQMGRRSIAFWELATLLVGTALVQALLLSIVLIAFPLVWLKRQPHSSVGTRPRTAAQLPFVLAYFALLGAGFMFLEMGFLQKLTLYLAHPVYSAAVVIACFLLFAGAGSLASAWWQHTELSVIGRAGTAVALVTVLCSVFLDRWLAWAQCLPLAGRVVVIGVVIAPLAFAMGHMFPVGLRLLGRAGARALPLAWAANGCASVIATVAAPLLAMHVGFRVLVLIAAGCYLAAVAASHRIR